MNSFQENKDLILSVARGNTKAFKSFYDFYVQKTYQFAHYYIKSDEICEEVVSDVFLNIWNTRDKLPDIENMEAFIFIVTRNKAYNYIDKISRNPGNQQDIPSEISIESSNPESILIAKELEKVISNSISELPERCRIIFLMAREKKLKYHEIAKLLSISENTVHAQMVTALKKLGDSIRKYMVILFL